MESGQVVPHKALLIAVPTIRRPHRRPNTLRRHRLLDHIHQNIHRKLSFVCAPAGYGKTTLITDFCEDASSRVAWCQVGPEDRDLRYFFRHLVLAFREIYPGFGTDLDGGTLLDGIPSPHSIAVELINEIAQCVDDFTVLVLDDYHVISSELTIVAFIEEMLDLLPENLRLIIGSRSVYGIPTSSLYVNEELSLLTMDDLRFRPGEINDLARQYFHVHLTEEQTETILARSDGWITSILLFLRDGAPSITMPRVEGAREQVYDYLAREVFTRLPGEIRRFLLQTALCDDFDAALANHLLGIEDAETVIRTLEDQNLFISSVQGETGERYAYHQLFRDFLAAQFHELPEDEQVEVNLRIAHWYEDIGDAVHAIPHYLQAGSREHAAAVMDRYAHSLYIEGQEGILEEWFEALSTPPPLRHLAPELVLNRVKARVNQGKLEGCLELLVEVEPLFTTQGKYDLAANLMMVRGMILRFQSLYEPAIEIARRTRQMVAKHGLDEYYTCQAARLEGLGLFHTGQAEQAAQAFEQALQGFRRLYEHQPSDRLKHDLIMLLTDIGMMSLLTGNIFEAQRSFAEALTFSLSLRGNQGDLATCANNQAYISFLMGDLSKAWQHYEQALMAAERAGASRTIVQVLNGQAEVLLLLGEPQKAEEVLRRAEKVSSAIPGGTVSPATHHGLADLACLRGDYNQAMYHLREAAHAGRLNLDDPDYLVRLGTVQIEMEELEAARQVLHSALQSLATQTRPSQVRALAHYALAEASYREDQESALAHLKQALGEAAALGYDSFLVNAAYHRPRLPGTLAQVWENQHLRSLLERAEKIPSGIDALLPQESSAAAGDSFTLQVKAFGRSGIRLSAEIIPPSAWKSAGARALFFFILDSNKPKRDEIASQFWPEFSDARANSNFHTTLWRVRNALGRKDVIIFDGESYSIHADELSYDVREFEDLLQRLRLPDLDPPERRNISRRAMELYDGDFLPDIDMTWSNQRRQVLREKYLLLLEQFAGNEFSQARFEEARRLYELAIVHDPWQDALHLGLMKCLLRLNAPAAARAHYARYRQDLDEALGVEPSEDLRLLVEGE